MWGRQFLASMGRGYSFKVGNRGENWFAGIRDRRNSCLTWVGFRRWGWIFLGMGSGWRTTTRPMARCGEAKWMGVRNFSSFLRRWLGICRIGLPTGSRSLFLGIRRVSIFSFI